MSEKLTTRQRMDITVEVISNVHRLCGGEDEEIMTVLSLCMASAYKVAVSRRGHEALREAFLTISDRTLGLAFDIVTVELKDIKDMDNGKVVH